MGLGPYKGGRKWPITDQRTSWAATVNEPFRNERYLVTHKRVAVTHDVLVICQQLVQGEGLDRNVRDAATEAIDGYRSGKGIDRAVAEVLFAYATKIGAQDRWGK